MLESTKRHDSTGSNGIAREQLVRETLIKQIARRTEYLLSEEQLRFMKEQEHSIWFAQPKQTMTIPITL